ncbi:MAG: hypothetical protein RBU27_05515 [Bacteroidota bacterium]|jgi:hypothetical protein|nr:hypothetical protein [Bacteroidota bacterium]
MSQKFWTAILDARISKLELATTIVVDHHPDCYLQLLRSTSRLDRTRHDPKGQTVYLENSRRKLTLYDKRPEMRKKRIPIPRYLVGRHLLRIELTLLADVHTQLGQKTPLKLADLLNPSVLMNAVDLWQREALTIRAESAAEHTVLPESAYLSVKAYLQALAYDSIQQTGGIEHQRKIIAAMAKDEVITRQQKYALNRTLEELAAKYLDEESRGLISELTTKIQAEAARLRLLYQTPVDPLPMPPLHEARPLLKLVRCPDAGAVTTIPR